MLDCSLNQTSRSSAGNTTTALATFPCIGGARAMVESYCSTSHPTMISALVTLLVQAQRERNPSDEGRILWQLHRLTRGSFRGRVPSGRPLLSRFFEKITSGACDCWYWVGTLHKQGYGIFHALGQSRAHRVSWILHCGTIPAGQMVLHRCDVPLCVNPDHLFLGTQIENMRDMTRKGRGKIPRLSGARNPLAKLTAADVHAMQLLRAEHGWSYAKIAPLFGVTTMTAYRAIVGQSWRMP